MLENNTKLEVAIYYAQVRIELPLSFHPVYIQKAMAQ